MQVHLFHRHVQDNVIILEEGKIPHPLCPRYDMLVPWCALNGGHLVTSKCAKGGERKSQQLEEEELWESTERAFQTYGKTLYMVTLFKYLGRFMTAGDDDWPAVVGNLRKAWNSWARMTRILGW